MQNFESYYQDQLVPVLTNLEEERLEVLKKLRKTRNILLAIGIPALSLMIYFAVVEGAILLGVVLVVIYFFLRKRFSSKYNAGFKTNVLGAIVKFIDEALNFDHTGTISERDFEATRIFRRNCDRYKGEDLVYGKLEKTDIRFSEVHGEYKTTTTDSKGRRKTSWHTIFKGILFIADFNKHFSSELYIMPDTLEKTFGKIGQKFQSIGKDRGELIKLEDPEFEKEFAIYGQDQVEGRYILSTSLMQRILDFKRKVGNKVYLSFIDSKVNVAIPMQKNLFEARINQTLLDYDYIKSNLDYFLLFTGIVEDLNLNKRIWTKT